MKFMIHRTRKDCVLPGSALAVAGLKRERELRLEVESGVIVVLRPEMNAKKLLSISEFLHNLATDLIVAVALACGECSCCGDCPGEDEDCECDFCESQAECHGVSVPPCLLEQAGIRTNQRWQIDAQDGVISISALEDDEDEDADVTDGHGLLDDLPKAARYAFLESDTCIPALLELLSGGDPVKF